MAKLVLQPQEMCAFCFRALLAKLQELPAPAAPDDWSVQVPGIFVTWLARGDEGEKLRGCRGSLKPQSLARGLAHYACRSAVDERMAPVTLTDVPSLTCRISILGCLEDCDDAYDWEVGPHGVHISFSVPIGGVGWLCGVTSYSATYLPEVMMSHGMSHEVAIRKLVRKSGYQGVCDDNLIESINASRFQARVCEQTFAEFARWASSQIRVA